MTELGVDEPFFVILGADYAGKSSTMVELAKSSAQWRYVSVDDEFLAPDHQVISQLKRILVRTTLPALGTTFSDDFAMSLLQTAVVYLRDQITAGGKPALVDSYYYKILAKCRLSGGQDNPMFDWWRSFPQPQGVLYLDVAPETAWRRSGAGARANRLEHYGTLPDRESFESFQKDLRKVMFEEIRHLPVSVIRESDDIARVAQDIREVVADGFDRR